MGAAAVQSESHISLQEYLAAEEKSDVRHEYWAGRVYAMAGSSRQHAQVAFNFSGSLYMRLRGKRCRGASNDQRVRIEATDVIVYPDVSVVCLPERYSEVDPNALLNPALIVEVLSPSTERHDRNEKFEHYSLIPELRDYILVSQERIFVEHFQRADDGAWILRRYNRREDILKLENIEIEVPLEEIYDGLDLPSGLVKIDDQANQ
jgi:Uma2 family endonuclease